MTLLERFQAHLRTLALPQGRALVAVSGGPDSMALLELLTRSVEVHRLALTVAHVDHGIHPESSRASARVHAAALARGLPYESVALRLGALAGETPARAARLAWLAETAGRLAAGLVFLGHHADDQTETVLMRALEGSGPAGLAGMPAVAGRLVRPLLPFSRIELADFVHREGLEVWIDPANADPRHLRSWIRTDVLPLLRSRLPAVDRRLRRLGAAASRQRSAWDAVLERLPNLDARVEPDGISIAGAPLRHYDSALSEALVTAAGRRVGCVIGPVRSARILRLLGTGRSGSEVPLGAGWRAELAFDRLRIVRKADAGEDAPWVLEPASGERQWGRWRLRWRPDTAPRRQERAAFIAWFSPGPLEVRPWRPGDKVRPLAGRGGRPVAHCFRERRVPHRRRTGWPVLARNDVVVWVPGVCRSDALVPAEGTEAVRVDAEYA